MFQKFVSFNEQRFKNCRQKCFKMRTKIVFFNCHTEMSQKSSALKCVTNKYINCFKTSQLKNNVLKTLAQKCFKNVSQKNFFKLPHGNVTKKQ